MLNNLHFFPISHFNVLKISSLLIFFQVSVVQQEYPTSDHPKGYSTRSHQPCRWRWRNLRFVFAPDHDQLTWDFNFVFFYHENQYYLACMERWHIVLNNCWRKWSGPEHKKNDCPVLVYKSFSFFTRKFSVYSLSKITPIMQLQAIFLSNKTYILSWVSVS